jgi:ABC-type methionine transport system ATPase subunit
VEGYNERGTDSMKTRVKLTFPQHLIKEPVIFTMAKKYDIIPNIRRARVTETVGEMVLELEGEDENIQKGIESLRQQGVDVELVEGDILE